MLQLHDLFDPQQLKTIEDAPLFMGMRHPTWFPLFGEQARSIDYLVHSAVRNISQESNGEEWLRDLTSRLMDMRAGFAVHPTAPADQPPCRTGAHPPAASHPESPR